MLSFHPSPHSRRSLRADRSGFTLIEILGVIIVIAILAALIVPAIQNAVGSTKEAGVSVEMQDLSQKIGQFKSEYGMEPPSSIVLREDGTGWSSKDIATLRRIFGDQIDFSTPRDYDRDGTPDDVVVLDGSECLVFFLGGPLDRAFTSGGSPSGFSKNPVNPFELSSSNRVKFHEFDIGRLVDPDGDGMPSLVDRLDSQSKPILYLSSYGGRGYANLTTSPDAMINDSTPAGVGSGTPVLTDFYRQGTAANSKAWNDGTFQLISPGNDGDYGQGGPWLKKSADSQLTGNRFAERDNITNFSGGTLAD